MNLLKANGRVYGVFTALLLGVVSTSTHATTVKPDFESIISDTRSGMSRTEFNVSESDDRKWRSLLNTLDFSFADVTKVQLVITTSKSAGKDTWIFDMTPPGIAYANIFDKPWAKGKAGMHHENIDCPPVAPVPLPAAAWLFMSGIAGLAAFRSKRSSLVGKDLGPVSS